MSVGAKKIICFRVRGIYLERGGQSGHQYPTEDHRCDFPNLQVGAQHYTIAPSLLPLRTNHEYLVAILSKVRDQQSDVMFGDSKHRGCPSHSTSLLA